MCSGVFLIRQNYKILRFVIQSVSIPVMHLFAGLERPPENLLSD